MNQNFAKVIMLTIFSVILGSGNYLNSQNAKAATGETGTLSLVANGEDFVRQGFVSKDGWKISFDHVYINLADVNAYQTESGFEPTKGETIDDIQHQAKVVLLNNAQTVDLATGDVDAAPILVNQTDTATGFYDAMSWKITPAGEKSVIPGQTMAMQGKARKNDREIVFNLSFNLPVEYVCGEYIGDRRKGIIEPGTSSELETTFHFDHLFGDYQTPADDTLNQEALGFQPLADLASTDKLNVDQTTLSNQLTPENYQKLTNAIIGLGHVGEGHCSANF